MKFIYLLLITFSFNTAVAQVITPPSEALLDSINSLNKINELTKQKEYINNSKLSKKDNNILLYIFAQNNKVVAKNKSCKIFTTLANSKDFMFRNLAKIRTNEVCIQKMPIKNEDLRPWTRKTYTELKLANCSNTYTKECALAYLEKSKHKLPYTEKVSYSEIALAKANNIKDQSLIKKITERLEKIAPRLKANIQKKDYLAVADDYKKNRDFDNAYKYYNKILNHSRSINEKIKARIGISKSYKLQRKYKTHVIELEKLHNYIISTYKKNPKLISTKIVHKSCQDYSRATWTYSKRTTAENVLNECIKLLKNKYGLSELYWVLGRIEEEKLNYQKAISWFKKAQKQKIRSKDLKEKIIWYTAWNERKLKKYDDAISSLELLIKTTDNPFSKAKYLFWKAHILENTKRTSTAKKIFQDIIYQTPMSYYALLSHKFLDKKISYAKPAINTNYETNEKLHTKLNLSYVDWLLILEEKEIAKTYLKSKVRKHRSKFNDNDFKTIFNYYARTELYLEFFYLVSILSSDRQIKLLSKNPEFLFPQPYKPLVDSISKKFEFNSNIIYSIMRQESAFNPKARSFADAFGLLQLIPKVAEKADRAINSAYESVDDLYNPDININLGAYYLKNQWNIYNQRFILATASYNATDRAIKSWIKTRYKGDPIEFIEDVPYEETRNYIKLVMRNYIFYKLVNSSGSIKFPEYCLNMDVAKL